MRQKWLLGAGAVVVGALIIYLMVSVRGAEGTASPAGETAGAPPPAGSGGGVSGVSPPPATPVAPEVKRPQPPPPVEDPPPEVRDHRAPGARRGDLATPSPIVPVTVGTVRKAMLPGVRSCGEALDIETQPIKIAVHAVIRSSAGKVVARDVQVTGAEVLGPAFADCVKRAYEGLAVDAAPEQPDGEDTVHMPWTVP